MNKRMCLCALTAFPLVTIEALMASEARTLLQREQVAIEARSQHDVLLKSAKFDRDEHQCLQVSLIPDWFHVSRPHFEVCAAVYDMDGLLVGAGRRGYRYEIPYSTSYFPAWGKTFGPQQLEPIRLGVAAAERGVRMEVSVFDLPHTDSTPRCDVPSVEAQAERLDAPNESD